MFIGHSMGGLVIKKVWMSLRDLLTWSEIFFSSLRVKNGWR